MKFGAGSATTKWLAVMWNLVRRSFR